MMFVYMVVFPADYDRTEIDSFWISRQEAEQRVAEIPSNYAEIIEYPVGVPGLEDILMV